MTDIVGSRNNGCYDTMLGEGTPNVVTDILWAVTMNIIMDTLLGAGT
jgi:hypothetical protein